MSAWSGSKLFETLMVFLKDLFEKVNLKKKSSDNKKASKITQHTKLMCRDANRQSLMLPPLIKKGRNCTKCIRPFKYLKIIVWPLLANYVDPDRAASQSTLIWTETVSNSISRFCDTFYQFVYITVMDHRWDWGTLNIRIFTVGPFLLDKALLSFIN